MRNILITTSSFGKHDAAPLEMLQEDGFTPVINPYGRKLTAEEARELISKYQPVGIVAGVEPLNAESLKDAEELQVISRCGIGMDNVDLSFTHEKQIRVTNTPDGPTVAVAELTLGMMISSLRKIHITDASIRSGQWNRPMGNLLHEKTVAVIGCGRIGSCLINLLKPFGCDVLGVDPVADECEKWVRTELEDALPKADIATLHIPHNKENHHLINKYNLSMMKNSSVLINASRGGLVDEEALYEALVHNRLAGAALDCFESEPYKGPLTKLENVLLTGHIGSYALEGRIAMEVKAVENLLKQIEK